MTYYLMENYSNALSHYQKALNIRQKSSQSIHPDTAVNFYNIAKAFEHLNPRGKQRDLNQPKLSLNQFKSIKSG